MAELMTSEEVDKMRRYVTTVAGSNRDNALWAVAEALDTMMGHIDAQAQRTTEQDAEIARLRDGINAIMDKDTAEHRRIYTVNPWDMHVRLQALLADEEARDGK